MIEAASRAMRYVGFEFHLASSALQRAMLSLFRCHFLTAFGTGGHRIGLSGLLGEQFAHDDLRNPVDLLDGRLLDRHQVGVGKIGNPAALEEPLHDEVSDLLGGGYG